jgi:hypothetical protein
MRQTWGEALPLLPPPSSITGPVAKHSGQVWSSAEALQGIGGFLIRMARPQAHVIPPGGQFKAIALQYDWCDAFPT